jgi:hypothetical protein
MAREVILENTYTKEIKQVPIGFSWTTLLFGVFVPLIRGDIKWFIIFLLLAFMTFGLAWLVIPFLYNKIYVKDLVSRGFVPVDEMSKFELRSRGIYFRDKEE